MAFEIAFMLLRDVIAQHFVWLLPIGAILLVALMPGAAAAVFRFLTGTLAGQIIIACLVSGLAAWFLRGFIDDAANRTREIVAARAATDRMDQARKEADARLAELRRQVEASNAILANANDRAATNEAAVLAYQQRESDYEAELDRADRKEAQAAPGRAPACALDDADVRGLRAAAGAYSAGGTGPAGPARKLRPPRGGS